VAVTVVDKLDTSLVNAQIGATAAAVQETVVVLVIIVVEQVTLRENVQQRLNQGLLIFAIDARNQATLQEIVQKVKEQQLLGELVETVRNLDITQETAPNLQLTKEEEGERKVASNVGKLVTSPETVLMQICNLFVDSL